jgi:hypothetical protein
MSKICVKISKNKKWSYMACFSPVTSLFAVFQIHSLKLAPHLVENFWRVKFEAKSELRFSSSTTYIISGPEN